MLNRVDIAEGTLFPRLDVEILGGFRPNSAASTDFHRFSLDVAEHHCDYWQNEGNQHETAIGIDSQPNMAGATDDHR